MFYYLVLLEIIMYLRNEVIAVPDDNKFIVTPKEGKSVTLTIRIYSEINDKLEKLSQQARQDKPNI